MKTNSIKTILATAFIMVMSFSAKADNGKKPFKLSPSMEVKTVEAGKVQINTNFIVSLEATNFEIQRSYDNKNFQSIAIIMGDAEAGCYQPFKINDKVNSATGKVYYRVVKSVQSKSSVISKTFVKIK